jgi:serine/threonine protein kinase
LCDALSHAHLNGLVHRNLKPSNVLLPDRAVSEADAAKLTDFGVGRAFGGDSLANMGELGSAAAYMAPEQAEGLPANAAADLYSLASVIYEALTGVNPMSGARPIQRTRRLGAHVPPVRRQRRDLPRELARGIDLALRPRPGERGTVAELRDALLVSREHLRPSGPAIAIRSTGHARAGARRPGAWSTSGGPDPAGRAGGAFRAGEIVALAPAMVRNLRSMEAPPSL